MKRAPKIALALIAAVLAGAGLIALSVSTNPSDADSPHMKWTPSWAGLQEAAHPNALWHVVHSMCVADAKTSGLPAPCVSVDLKRGIAVIKDFENPTQYLLVPTDHIIGIESPALQAPGVRNYWQDAWDMKPLLEKRLGKPVAREDYGLAVNSIDGRTQQQLHIHADCVRIKVRNSLKAHAGQIGARWSNLVIGPSDHRYRVRWLDGEELGEHDPLKILYRTDPVAHADMAHSTLVVIGASRPNGAPGFVLLTDRSDGSWTDRAAGEELLDHACKAFNPQAAPAPAK